MSTSKEVAYDEHISPLMAEIIRLCKEHKINMAAQFSLDYDEGNDSPLYCTTVLPDVDSGDTQGMERMLKLRGVMKPPPAKLYAFTIISHGPAVKP